MFSYRLMGMAGVTPAEFTTGVTDLVLAELPGGAMLYSVNRPSGSGGIAAYRLDAGFGITALAQMPLGRLVQAGDLPQIAVIPGRDLRETGLLLTAGLGAGPVVGMPIGAAGLPLGPVMLPDLAALGGLRGITQGAAGVIAALPAGGGPPLLWDTAPGGVLVPRGAGAPQAAAPAPGWDRLALAEVDGKLLLVTASAGRHEIALLREGAPGQMVHVETLGMASGIGIGAPSALAISQTGSGSQTGTGSYLLVAGAGSSSLTVFRLDADGGLILTDHVLDSLHSRFGGASVLETLEIGGRSLVLAGGADQGLSLLLLLPGGQLVHLGALTGSFDMPLDALGALAVRALAGTDGGSLLQVFAAGQSGGIAQIRIDLGVLAPPRFAGNAALLEGGTANDLLLAGSGPVTLAGGAGDDILVAGAGAVTMTGGAGRDLFVMSANGQRNLVTDFRPGEDRLDLSAFPMLRSAAQLGFTQVAGGAELSFGQTRISIRSADGRPLSLEQLGSDLTGGISRVLPYTGPVEADVEEPPPGRAPLALPPASPPAPPPQPDWPMPLVAALRPGMIRHGSAADDLIEGGAGDDTLRGHDGNDRIFGGDGNDQLYGGEGNDLIYGGGGNDLLSGGNGHDQLWGGGGNDHLSGGFGRDVLHGGPGDDFLGGGPNTDTLYGGPGNDILSGNKGPDLLYGGAGDDLITGSTGADTIWGGEGDDWIYGGAGHDVIHGDEGDDVIFGGKGHDEIRGGDGDDLIWGDGGHDVIRGDDGDDMLSGGNGNDRLYGGAGNDLLYGGDGNDILDGGPGNDILFGGAGADVFVFTRDPGPPETDIIGDFTPGEDRIDLSHWRLAQPRLIGSADFSGRAGELRLEAAPTFLRLELDADGNGQADLTLLLDGVFGLGMTDFLF